MDTEIPAIRTVAPEDLKRDDYVTVVQTTAEFLILCDDAWRPKVETTRATFIPNDAGEPLKVVEACVPFVLVKSSDGKHRTLDLRRHRLARLDPVYAKRAFKRLSAKDAAPCVE